MAAKDGEARLNDWMLHFGTLVGNVRRIQDCPYPILAANYLGLRAAQEAGERLKDVTLAELDTLFRAYYWRVVLRELYNQGFLTGAVKDLDFLCGALDDNGGGLAEDSVKWSGNMNSALKKQVEESVSRAALIDLVMDGDLGGARWLGCRGLLFLNRPRDLKTNRILEDEPDVELHHIFPKAWVRDNISSEEARERVNCISNLVPLTTESNGEWSAKGPKVALAEWGKDAWATAAELSESLMVGHKAFRALVGSKYEQFVRLRAEDLAQKLEALQSVPS